MSSVVVIDYENIPTNSNAIRNYAKEINQKLLDVYKQIEGLHEYWYGQRYNELVAEFNKIVANLNQFLNILVLEVPSVYEQIANEFSNVDIQKNIATIQKEDAIKIQEIEIKKDEGMKFITSDAERIQKLITTDFNDTSTLIDSIQRAMVQINIKCDGIDEFNSELTKLINVYKDVIANIIQSFTKLMNTAKAQIELAEKTNKLVSGLSDVIKKA